VNYVDFLHRYAGATPDRRWRLHDRSLFVGLDLSTLSPGRRRGWRTATAGDGRHVFDQRPRAIVDGVIGLTRTNTRPTPRTLAWFSPTVLVRRRALVFVVRLVWDTGSSTARRSCESRPIFFAPGKASMIAFIEVIGLDPLGALFCLPNVLRRSIFYDGLASLPVPFSSIIPSFLSFPRPFYIFRSHFDGRPCTLS